MKTMSDPLDSVRPSSPRHAAKPAPVDGVVPGRFESRGSLGLRDLYIMVKERVWLALPVALLGAIAFGYFEAQQQPLYSSTAVLRVEKTDRVVTTQEVVDTNINSDMEFNTYLQIIGSDSLRVRVLRSLTPDDWRVVKGEPPPGSPPEKAPPGSEHLGAVSVASTRNTLLIRVTVTHPRSAAAALLADRYCQQFIEYLLDSVSGKNEYAVGYLEKRAVELQAASAAADQRMQNYMARHNLVSLDGSTNIATSRLTTLNEALQRARLARLGVEDQANQIEQFQREGRSLLTIEAISHYGSLPELLRQRELLERDRDQLSKDYLENHPRMVANATASASVEKQIGEVQRQAADDLRTAMEKARSAEATLEREYAAQEKELLRLRDLSIEYRSLENQAQVAKSNYAQILDRLSQATTSKALGKPPVRLLDHAIASGTPVSPNISRILRQASGIGAGLFLAMVFALHRFDDRVKSMHDIEHVIDERLLGIVPSLNASDDEKYQMMLPTRRDQSTHLLEPFHGLHAAVNLQSQLDFPKAVMLTSTVPGEGKTLVASNLAGCFAYHGRSVLLIDADLRRPTIHHRFGLSNDRGLITWYAEGGAASDVAKLEETLGIKQVGPHFSILTSGGRSKHPTQIFEDPRFGALIEALKSRFDLVVVDTPPLGAVSDALHVAKAVDEVIYVCRFNRVTRRHVRLNIGMLKNSEANMLGVVFNGLAQRDMSYYSDYRYYRSYSKYYGT